MRSAATVLAVALAVSATSGAAGPAAAPKDGVPTPPARPGSAADAKVQESAPIPSPPPAPAQPGLPNTIVTEDLACRERLQHLGLAFDVKPNIATGDCRIDTPVELRELASGIRLDPPAIVSCPAAEAVARWVAEVVVPQSQADLVAPPTEIHVAASYVCRTRNNQDGAPMSEHSLGHAIDLSALDFKGRASVDFEPKTNETSAVVSWRASIRRAACGYFTTVLGPGADPEHANHLHLDIKERSNGYRICE